MSSSPYQRSRSRLRPLHCVPLVLLLGACGDDSTDDGGDDLGDGSGPEPTLVERTAVALGGAAAIEAARSEHVEATGTRLDPGGQDPRQLPIDRFGAVLINGSREHRVTPPPHRPST